MDVGATLQNARERRGLSIESLSRITRIKPDLLRAIEADAFDHVPGGIFLRGFLRSYAREVGLDPEVIVRSFAEEFETAPPPAHLAAPPARDPLADLPRRPLSDAPWLRPHLSAQWAGLALIVAAFAGYTFVGGRSSARSEDPSASARSAVPAGETQAQAASGTYVPAGVGTAGSVLHVDIAPTGPCWVMATADGERVSYGLLQAGDHRTVAVRDGIELRVGDPATFRYTIDGIPGRVLGRPAEPVTVRIAPSNFREFVAKN